MEKLRAGIVGCGWASLLHKPGWQALVNEDIVEVVACCDMFRDRAEERASLYGAKKVYVDFEKMAKDPDIDIIDVTTIYHTPVAVAAAEGGKHVLVEKPFAMTVEECDQMIGAAEKAGVRITNAEEWVYHPPHMKLREVIKSGEIGEPTSMYVRYGGGMPRRDFLWGALGTPIPRVEWESENWHKGAIAAGLRRIPQGTEPTPGAKVIPERERYWGRAWFGNMFGFGVHVLATAYSMLGDWEKVWAVLKGEERIDEIDGLEYVRDRESWMMWKIRGKDVYGVCENSRGPVSQNDEYRVTGTEAVAWVTSGTGRILDLPPVVVYNEYEVKKYCTHPWLARQYPASGYLYAFIAEIRDFVTGILENREFLWTAQDGKRIVEIMLAFQRSHREGRSIDLELAS